MPRILVVYAFVGTLVGVTFAAEIKRPNVVVILSDDMGYECLGAYGSTSYKTPVLDKLAATGVRFDHAYAQPLCTPTRVQLMTGIYNIRNYLKFGDMDPKAKTFGNVFKEAGYATCIVGKWQLGRVVSLPKTFGFDESCLWQHLRRPERYRNPGLEINGVAKDYTAGEYGPDLVNAYAIDFITRHKADPFFLYYPMMLTHAPYDPTPDSPDYGDAKPNNAQNHRHFADMVAYADKMVGKLLARLDELGIRENTLVIFMGDNGTGKGTVSMLGDRKVVGGKGTTTDAGMHVPLIVSRPGYAVPGTVSRDLVDSTDILPTICEAAGIVLPLDAKIDGRSFLPQVRGEKGNPRDWYYSWYAPHEFVVAEFAATRDYKLYRNGDFHDLRNDLDETRPMKVETLDGQAAAVASRLQTALDSFKNARPAAIIKPDAPRPKAIRKAALR